MKTFPKLQIIFIFLIFSLQFCQKEESIVIDTEQFIEIYARLLIINELKVNKEFHDRLLQELYAEYQITAAEIDSSVSYYNSNPREWIDIYNRVREKIQKIKNEYKIDSIKRMDSLLSKPKSAISTHPKQKGFIKDDPDVKIKEEQKEIKSEEIKKDQSEEDNNTE